MEKNNKRSHRAMINSVGVVLEKELMLHEAVITNEPEIVRELLSDGEDLNVDCRNKHGRTPIHLAASRGNTEILSMLIKAKCDLEVEDKFGMRPLHMAAWYGQQQAVDMLIKAGATVSAVDKKGRTLLMMGSHSGGQLVELLLEAEECKSGPARDLEGCGVVHYAARAGQTEAIRALLKHLPDLDLDAPDQKGQTALHHACREGHQEAALLLQELGSSAELQDGEGCTPLHVAAQSRESRLCLRLLEQCGPEPRSRLMRIEDQRGFCLVHIAASLGCEILIGGLLELEPPRRALRLACRQGNTALHLAALNNQLSLIDYLIERGAPLHALNMAMQTPLQLATEMGHNQACRILLSAESEAQSPDDCPAASADSQVEMESEGQTALHVAAKSSLETIANMIARTARLDNYPALLSITDK